ncbi:uncharacterized protein SPPG_05703 [Spizellomyces punctatus DAOM BR117]|uniref:Barwin domain-containing protein n=1 Tax=Spizellomyces punctatus (strain DAOM BR117) TaxID=645134 RepID=A0A0L0HED7_SPIPD|nr:uncharacterized protein SPPG_05703 [Spizellomyces punctatus DAOM BR117]KNC99467.1 hypothetical protein SPPG_05703 [Spizellomyces punctatus DAOM BR117]|eukprot:XP_016607507.1 hypothetical protein SPPG_05703 [Spizellomyces punctatus DAOM BR117]
MAVKQASELFLTLLVLVLIHSTTAANWRSGHATHYGPYPSVPAQSEFGYLPNDVGVGCSTGEPGGDPRWNDILSKGVYQNPVYNQTVWPKQATVAVSEAVYASTPADKTRVCFQKVRIKSRVNGVELEAFIVDFCPAVGCNWSQEERGNNVDLYGEYTWKALGGEDGGGMLAVDIVWPDGLGLDSGRGSGLAGIVIAAIVVSCLAFLATLGWAIWWHVKRRRSLAAFEAQKSNWTPAAPGAGVDSSAGPVTPPPVALTSA